MRESEGLYRSFTFIKQLFLGIASLFVGLLIFGYFIFMRHVDAPKAWSAADRELKNNMLQYGEHVMKRAKVYERRPTDYFRASNGVLYATNDRVIFIGIAPTDQLESSDAPPIIITEEYPNDTLLSVRHQRLFFMTAHGAVVQRPGYRRGLYGAISGDAGSLNGLIDYVTALHAKQRADAAAELKLRQSVKVMVRQPLYYTVKRGDALFLIATKFGATPDQIKGWNNLPSDRVKIGQRLLVKPGTK